MPKKPTVEKDIAVFNDTGSIPDIPAKEDVKRQKIIADETQKIETEKIKTEVRESLGEEKPAEKGTMTKDVPQLVFKLVGGFIECKKFELDDDEATTMATHLNVLLPLSGKAASVVIVLMITLNKVLACMDSIKAKLNKPGIETSEKKPELPEPIG